MPRILIADDDIEQLTLQRKLLESLGYEVGTALTPSAALEELAGSPPDLIVADLRFPRAGDGLGLIRAIREKGWETPLILLSGWPDEVYGAPEEAMVSRVVMKGSIRELLAAIAELLAG